MMAGPWSPPSTPRWIRPALTLALVASLVHGECELPTHWRGGWFQSGVHEVISITSTEFSTKGSCHAMAGEKYLLKDKNDGCFRCVAINEKHQNILQYKETLCEPISNLRQLCAQITGDALLFSMFRRDAVPASCPFKGPLTFGYTRGHGHCDQPASTIDSCTSDSRLLFKYQACPDVQGTESSVEEVECLGHWKEGTTRYFVGRLEGSHAVSDEDKYRCFAWERAREHESRIDFRMAQSGDATCNGVTSADDGSKTLKIKKAGSYSGCEFPAWVTAHRRWHALDKGASYSVAHRNTTMRLHHAHAAPPTPPAPPTSPTTPHPEAQRDGLRVYGGTEARLVCFEQREVTPSRVKLVAHTTTGCSSGYVCTVLYLRDSHVIEMQQGTRATRPEDACKPLYFNSTTATHTTLTSGSPSRRACPFVGVWSAQGGGGGGGGGCGEGDVTHLRAGCNALHSLHFVRSCDGPDDKHSYVCHGHWAEGSSVFVVASPHERPSHRVCLTATSFKNPASNTTRTLQITAHAHSCPRRHVPPTTTLNLNLTAQGECSVTSGSLHPSGHPTLPLLLLALSLASVFSSR